jgi:uncharacterized protein (TIGR03067 family)
MQRSWRFLPLIAIFAALCLGCTPAVKDPASSPAEELRGSWRALSNNGRVLADTGVEIIWFFGGDEIVVSLGSGEVVSRSPYVVDVTQVPHHINMYLEGPPQEDRPGVYEINGQNLRIAFSVDGSPRPASVDGREVMLFIRAEEANAN